MGYGSYSHEAHEALTARRGQATIEAVFPQTRCHPLLNPYGVRARECRDSEAHPQALPIVFALDVSGSMGQIPHALATATLPTFMKALGDLEIADPQLLFIAVGNARCDEAPLQAGQFESTEALIDFWLTTLFLEGGGAAGNESYELAAWFVARHVETDHQKRGKKGYFFMTGDEPPNPAVVQAEAARVLGVQLDADQPTDALFAELSAHWEPFFVIPDPGRASIERQWREILGDRVIVLQRPEDMSAVCAGLVALGEGAVADLPALMGRLGAWGIERARLGGLYQALVGFAAFVGRDGLPTPFLAP